MRRSTRSVLLVVIGAALALAGCADDPGVDGLRDQAGQVVNDVRSAADDVTDRIAGAGLDEQTRETVDEAVEAARAAIDEARTALAQTGEDTGARTQDALDRAGERLEVARAQVADAAGRTDGAVRSALDALAAQIDRLVDEVRR